MPKVTGPLFSITALGTLGKVITFQKNRSGSIVTKMPVPKKGTTEDQEAARSKFQAAAASWSSLTENEKANWNSVAAGTKQTGFNIYLKEYLTGTYILDQGIYTVPGPIYHPRLDELYSGVSDTGQYLGMAGRAATGENRTAIRWQLPEWILADDVTITGGTLRLYMTGLHGSVINYRAAVMTTEDWIGTEAGWIDKNAADDWDSPGGDYIISGNTVVTFERPPHEEEWFELDIFELVKYCHENKSGLVDILIMMQDPTPPDINNIVWSGLYEPVEQYPQLKVGWEIVKSYI